MIKPNYNYLLSLIILLLFFSCKREIAKPDFGSGNGNLIKVFGIDSLKGITPFAQFNRPGGGYLILYQPGAALEAFKQLNGVIAAATDENWNVIHSEYMGGSGTTVIWGATMDDFGNVYVCGQTSSKDIRTDIWVDSPGIDKTAAYLGKVNKDASIQWQVSYSDAGTTTKGVKMEAFYGLELLNNQPYCIGENSNYDTSFTSMLVKFNENGQVLKHQILPPLFKGKYPLINVVLVNGPWMDIIKLSESEFIVRNEYFLEKNVPEACDTSAYLLRYNVLTDKIMWLKYYKRSSQQLDLTYCGRLGNGNLAFFDYFFNTLNIIDVNNGDPINTVTIHQNTFQTTYYYNPIPYMRGTIDGELYFTGGVAYASQFFGRNPFVIKLNSSGQIEYEKIFTIPESGFYGVSKNKNGNLQFLGGNAVFETKRQKIFTICTNKSGEILSK